MCINLCIQEYAFYLVHYSNRKNKLKNRKENKFNKKTNLKNKQPKTAVKTEYEERKQSKVNSVSPICWEKETPVAPAPATRATTKGPSVRRVYPVLEDK